jgi:hypothetical protein
MAERKIVLTEEQLQRLTIDALAGKRVLPADPEAAALARKLWAEIDAIAARGGIVDVPPSIPDVGRR